MRNLILTYLLLQITVDSSAQLREDFINIQDGKLFCQVKGSGPPIVFLHGVCLDHRMWDQQVQYFSKSYTCIYVDLRGFGKSSVPVSPYSFHEDIKVLLDSLHVNQRVTLIALSMGGKAAINFALAYPDRTKNLILADAAVDGFSFKELNFGPISETAKLKGVDSANQLFLKNDLFAFTSKNRTAFNNLQKMILSYSGWQWLNKNPIKTLEPIAMKQLDRITAPVLIITGEKDISDFQEIADLLHKSIKGSVKKQIPGAGHMSNMEKPKVFNSLVNQFLSSHRN